MSDTAITWDQLGLFFAWYGREQEVVDAVTCPVCGAPVGTHCPPNEYGKPDIHVGRLRAYESA